MNTHDPLTPREPAPYLLPTGHGDRPEPLTPYLDLMRAAHRTEVMVEGLSLAWPAELATAFRALISDSAQQTQRLSEIGHTLRELLAMLEEPVAELRVTTSHTPALSDEPQDFGEPVDDDDPCFVSPESNGDEDECDGCAFCTPPKCGKPKPPFRDLWVPSWVLARILARRIKRADLEFSDTYFDPHGDPEMEAEVQREADAINRRIASMQATLARETSAANVVEDRWVSPRGTIYEILPDKLDGYLAVNERLSLADGMCRWCVNDSGCWEGDTCQVSEYQPHHEELWSRCGRFLTAPPEATVTGHVPRDGSC